MSKLKVHAGDFQAGTAHGTGFSLWPWATWRMAAEWISAARIASLEMVDESSIRKGGSIGVGLAGAAIAGPVIGLVLGLAAKKTKREVTFHVCFDDGRQMVASVDGVTWVKILSNYRMLSVRVIDPLSTETSSVSSNKDGAKPQVKDTRQEVTGLETGCGVILLVGLLAVSLFIFVKCTSSG